MLEEAIKRTNGERNGKYGWAVIGESHIKPKVNDNERKRQRTSRACECTSKGYALRAVQGVLHVYGLWFCLIVRTVL